MVERDPDAGRTTGSELLARALKQQGVDTFFYLMGGPMLSTEKACVDLGLRAIDVRHEQAAAMMAHAYSRLLNRPGVCMAASGPGATNLVTGVANAFVDGAPLVALGGLSDLGTWGRGAFQEMDQLAMFKPITKWAERVYHAARLPELFCDAFRHATSGRPAPVYLDLPGDVLYEEVDNNKVDFPDPGRARPGGRTPGDPGLVKAAVRVLAQARRPLVISGSGVLWSGAMDRLREFVDLTGIPFYTTPQGRGVIPEDHPLAFLSARSTAFREADCLLVVGTRLNYVLSYGRPPVFAPGAKVIRVDVDPVEIGHGRVVDVGIVGDAAAVLGQLAEEAAGVLSPRLFAAWAEHLLLIDRRKRREAETAMANDQVPIHPLRLCREIRDYLERDAIVCVDGQDTLTYGRQVIPTFVAGHRLNAGPAGTMGVALSFGIGAKVAKPDKQVLVLHGDGSFGLNAMELDTALRHNLPVVTVINSNGGWGSDPEGKLVGRDLGYTRYDLMAVGLGCHGEFVERPQDIRPALERAFSSGRPAVVNVVTARARAKGREFLDYPGAPTSSQPEGKADEGAQHGNHISSDESGLVPQPGGTQR